MEFLKLIYLSLIKKPKKKKKRGGKFSYFSGVFFVFFSPLGQFCSSKLCSHTQ